VTPTLSNRVPLAIGRWPNGSLFAIIVAITLRVMNARGRVLRPSSLGESRLLCQTECHWTPAQWQSICDYSSHHSPSDECQGPRFAAFVTQRVTSTLSNRVPLAAGPGYWNEWPIGPTPNGVDLTWGCRKSWRLPLRLKSTPFGKQPGGDEVPACRALSAWSY